MGEEDGNNCLSILEGNRELQEGKRSSGVMMVKRRSRSNSLNHSIYFATAVKAYTMTNMSYCLALIRDGGRAGAIGRVETDL